MENFALYWPRPLACMLINRIYLQILLTILQRRHRDILDHWIRHYYKCTVRHRRFEDVDANLDIYYAILLALILCSSSLARRVLVVDRYNYWRMSYSSQGIRHTRPTKQSRPTLFIGVAGCEQKPESEDANMPICFDIISIW